ncbi:hypothetical protein CCY99_02365 [Helicobacter sp. 16-1353]|uniref:hypothetical protein n=1 Tax=Helicobacter sp. 16-1353 TaxID=2004996 RepID=UPI000DCC91B2|nr:hypothetical protein [Helicobacter sp. 16-1353]RAX54627.1 hypothetical protein CCY99_02365 [Helicobacter sp. 16-1353]
MQAVIFTEAGSNFGLGHLSRCVALKDYLVNAGFETTIYSRGSFSSNDCVSLEWLAESSKENLKNILHNKPLVFVDSYYADFALCEYINKMAKVCVFFDDFNRMQYPKNSIILNGALNAQKYYIDVCNEMFVGIEYFLLRKEFRQKEHKIINKDISRILITLGGNDEANNNQKVLEILEKECYYAMIDIVIGEIHKPLSYGFNTNVHKNLSPNVLKNLMLDCDIAISGGGVTMVELQSMKTPTIALQIAPNQAYQLRAWQKEGLRLAENVYQIKGLLKTLKKFKDRKKLFNRLSKIEIGAKVPDFITIIVDKYNA